jgi:hypothetical protein
MAEKENIPEHIEQYYKKKDQLERLLNTTEVMHSKAYDEALSVITDKNGEIDYKLLKEDKKRLEFINKLSDQYISAAKKAFKSDVKGDFQENQLLQAYIGITKEQLADMVHENRHNYTKEKHNSIASNLKREQHKGLSRIVGNHLKDEHVDSIVKYTHAGDFVDAHKMRKEDAMGLLDVYKKGKGAITEEFAEGEVYQKKKAA